MSRRNTVGRKVWVGILSVVIVLGIFLFVTLFLPLSRAYAHKTKLQTLAKATFDAAKKQDLVLLEKNVAALQKELRVVTDIAQPAFMYKHVPLVGYVLSDMEHGMAAADYLLSAGKQSVVALEPYADLIGFKKGSQFSNQSTEDRLETAILTIDKLVPQIDKISVDLEKAQKELEQINPQRYPKKIGKYVIRDKVNNAYTQITGIVSLATDAKPLFKQLPKILGKDEEQKYLVLFLNDKELRPTGGFITAYALFSIDKGQIRIAESSDIYDLDNTINHPAAPDEIRRYHKGVSQFFIRDSNISPDYVKSIGYFEDLLARGSKELDYDGIISIDTRVLTTTLAILGPTEAGGITFTADNDPRCDCPQVIYELENVITRPTPYFREQRKSLLSVLLFNIMQKALGVSPSQYWGRLSQNFLTELDEKHILVYLEDTEAQKAIESIGYGGRIKATTGDYLHINNTNFAGAKSNLYISYKLDSVAKKQGNMIEREVTLEYRNSHPASDCNLERGNLCLNAPLRNWVRVYVPKGAKLVKFVGSEMPVREYTDLDKQVFEGFLIIQPMGIAKIRVTYQIPDSVLGKEGAYQLMIQKQPGVEVMDTTVSYDNTTWAQPLKHDTIITL
ncbi:MAG: DUF4012 domain-containing protein [Candidatus Roizmanbacteria bacterium]|nr:DUF4012 domain-containing protein [Candidatus Roizmanbacteria bacterium]